MNIDCIVALPWNQVAGAIGEHAVAYMAMCRYAETQGKSEIEYDERLYEVEPLAFDPITKYMQFRFRMEDAKEFAAREAASKVRERELDLIYGPVYDRICAAIKERGVSKMNNVIYSVFGDDGMPLDNLDEVAVRGPVRFVRDGYISNVMIDPTGLDVAVVANDAIEFTEDYHHVFFEGLSPTNKRDENGVPYVHIIMGS